MNADATLLPFRSRLHDEWLAAVLGISLGVAFTTCFATGLVSHVAYDQPSWWPLGPRPAGLYRVTQGVHVATGIASIPLLLVKLWVVYPRFWTRPPVQSVAHAVERLSLLPLVGGSLFLLLSGAGNLARWRPWGFFFTDGHYHAAWITIGGLVVHIGAKISTTARVLGDPPPTADPDDHDHDTPDEHNEHNEHDDGHGLTRRQLLGVAGAASALLTAATVGQTVRPLAGLSVLAPRDPRVGPQGVPVNKSASAARVLDTVTAPGFDDGYRLDVERAGTTIARLRLDDLRALPVTEAVLPITCVEGWSAEGTWRGVAVRDLFAALDAPLAGRVVVESMERRGRYRTSELTDAWLRDEHTLLAYELHDEPLHADHGAPLRLIAPNRPGVLQTKWVTRLVLA